MLSGFGSIKGWMPMVDHCSVRGDGIGAVRTVVCGGGPPVDERLETFEPDKHTISYRIMDPTGLPMKGGFSTVSLVSTDNGTRTEMTWRSDAEEIDQAGVRTINPIFLEFIRASMGYLKEVLARPGKPLL